jgi:predicted nucleic acid-binding Zn ribbon protein
MAVGASLARVSHVAASSDGHIDVTVDDARWQHELERSKNVILGRLQAVLGADVARVLNIQGPARDDRRGTHGARQPHALKKQGR